MLSLWWRAKSFLRVTSYETHSCILHMQLKAKKLASQIELNKKKSLRSWCLITIHPAILHTHTIALTHKRRRLFYLNFKWIFVCVHGEWQCLCFIVLIVYFVLSRNFFANARRRFFQFFFFHSRYSFVFFHQCIVPRFVWKCMCIRALSNFHVNPDYYFIFNHIFVFYPFRSGLFISHSVFVLVLIYIFLTLHLFLVRAFFGQSVFRFIFRGFFFCRMRSTIASCGFCNYFNRFFFRYANLNAYSAELSGWRRTQLVLAKWKIGRAMKCHFGQNAFLRFGNAWINLHATRNMEPSSTAVDNKNT